MTTHPSSSSGSSLRCEGMYNQTRVRISYAFVAITSPPQSVTWHDGHGAPLTRSRPHPIGEAFHKTTIYPEKRSYGNRDASTPTSLLDLSILEPQMSIGNTRRTGQSGLATSSMKAGVSRTSI